MAITFAGASAMRLVLGLLMILLLSSSVVAQEKGPPRRFGIIAFEEIYPQATPKQALASALETINRDRYDYLVAHLLDPAFVDEQLASAYPVFEKQARDKAEAEGLLKTPAMRQAFKGRLADIANINAFDDLTRRMKTKHADDPQSLKDLKRMLSEGMVEEQGNNATYRLKEFKDRALYLKRIDGRWFLENRLSDNPEK